jgi:hypothetical protein
MALKLPLDAWVRWHFRPRVEGIGQIIAEVCT